MKKEKRETTAAVRQRRAIAAVCVGMILFSAASWCLTIVGHRQSLETLEEQKAAAEALFQKQIYDEALSEYKACLELDPEDASCMKRVAEIYHLTGQENSCLAWCERTLRKTPGAPEICYLEAQAYDSQKKIASAIAALKKADKTAGDTTEIDRYLLELKGRYDLTYFTFQAISPWFLLPDGTPCATVAESTSLSIYSAEGKEQVSGPFTYLGASSDEELLFPVRAENSWFYVDESGERRLVPDKEYSYLGSFLEGLACARRDDMAGFLDHDLKEMRFEFQETCPMKSGYALAKKDGTWFVLDSSLQEVTACTFTEIKKDVYGNAQKCGMILGKLPGEEAAWAMFAPDGSQTIEFTAEDFRLPEEKRSPVAFLKGGKWGFVDPDGTVLLQPAYEDAFSFSKGLAAVKLDGKWGYIDKKGNVIIPFSFDGAGPFSSKGTAFVQNHAGYSLLTLSRYAES